VQLPFVDVETEETLALESLDQHPLFERKTVKQSDQAYLDVWVLALFFIKF
jgi:hypothetical protein